MTISSTTSRAEYAGNGVTTVFAFPYPFFADADLTVLLLRTTGVVDTLVLNTDYTVSGENTPSSGQVTLTVAPASGESLFILRQLDLTQETDYISGDPFPAESHERALDRLTLIAQQLQEQIDRSVKVSETSGSDPTQIVADLEQAAADAAVAAVNAGASATAAAASAVAADASADAAAVSEANAAATLANAATKGAIGSSGLTMATSRLLGRTTASTGVPEEITVGAGLTLSGGSLSATGLRGFIDGLIMSTAGSSTTMSIAAGQAIDSANAALITLAASISKTTSAWAVGTAAGGLDTGSIANSTWYYFYLIRRPDTGVVDVVFSTNSTSPTLPTNYTQFRYIGAGLTNGSGQWTKFVQTGDLFYWDIPVLDFNGNGNTSGTTLTCSVPRGRKVLAFFNTQGTGSEYFYLSDPDLNNQAPSATATPLATTDSQGLGAHSNQSMVRTNTSAQIRHRSSGTATMRIATLGWQDIRGKDV